MNNGIKVFISSDIEGTNGICHWDETDKSKPDYTVFAQRMTEEVAAVCNGVNDCDPGAFLWIKDAHETARNLNHACLPENTVLNRCWSRTPYSMMYGIDKTFDAVIFTGYHSGAGCNGNPLAHTMNQNITYLKINGMLASECLVNYYSALYNGVPVVMVCGDEALCKEMQEIDPCLYTVPTLSGVGASVTARHPAVVLQELRETAREAVANRGKMNLTLPKRFEIELRFRVHATAIRASYYPGAQAISGHAVAFATDDYFEFLRFFMFVNVE